MQTVYENKTGQTTKVCHKCESAKNFDTTKFDDMNRRLKAKCKCNDVFGITNKFRRRYRKKVSLRGEYIIQNRGKKGGLIVVNLSMSGIQFENLGPFHISIDDRLEVNFKLDNPLKSEIKKMVRIKWVGERIVGAMYKTSQEKDADLEYYLRT